jgi:tetratricopeptide (TPR) repeat protein
LSWQSIALRPPRASASSGRRSLSLYKSGNKTEADEAFQTAFTLDPDAASANFKRGKAFVLQEKYAEAEKHFLKAVESDSDYFEAYSWLGFTYANQKKISPAVEAYKKAIEICTRDSRGDNVRAKIQEDLQHFQKDTDFNGVRGESALAKLPERERQEWQALWREVEELRNRAAGK